MRPRTDAFNTEQIVQANSAAVADTTILHDPKGKSIQFAFNVQPVIEQPLKLDPDLEVRFDSSDEDHDNNVIIAGLSSSDNEDYMEDEDNEDAMDDKDAEDTEDDEDDEDNNSVADSDKPKYDDDNAAKIGLNTKDVNDDKNTGNSVTTAKPQTVWRVPLHRGRESYIVNPSNMLSDIQLRFDFRRANTSEHPMDLNFNVWHATLPGYNNSIVLVFGIANVLYHLDSSPGRHDLVAIVDNIN